MVVRFDSAAADLPASAVLRVVDTARGFAHWGLQVAAGGEPVEQVISAESRWYLLEGRQPGQTGKVSIGAGAVRN